MDYKEPGNISELKNSSIPLWQRKLSSFFEEGKYYAKNEAIPPYPKSWFFNPLTDGTDNTKIVDIGWNAFPKRLLDDYATKKQAWRAGDSTRKAQEEYCEWEVVRDENQNVIRVTFTTETKEYYEFLYKNEPDLLLSLYKKHVSSNVELSDLGNGGVYDRKNKWNYPERINKRGVLMHMAYKPNTLVAAMILSAEATWPSVDGNGNLITDEQGLIHCRGYGAPERHSDPHIGAQINNRVRLGNEISFAGPTGLYIDNIDFSRFEVPDGVDAKDLFKLVRGDKNHMMRVMFEVPSELGFTLSDVKIDGEEIFYGGQIAETLKIRIRGLERDINGTPPKIDCTGQQSPNVSDITLANFEINGTRKQYVSYLKSSE